MYGQVLTIDAMIATITAIAMVSVMAGMLSTIGVSSYTEQQMAAIGHDLLSVMYTNGTLNSYVGKPAPVVNACLQQELGLMPSSYCSNMTLKLYRASDFQLTDSYAANTGCSTGVSVTKVRRIFADYSSGKFGLAEITIWLRT